MLQESKIQTGDFAQPDPMFFREQPAAHQEIISWARSCPDGTILDIAAGFGTQVLALQQAGFSVIGQEPDPYYRYWSQTPLMDGRAESLYSFDRSSIAGAFMKDSLIFLSHQQRADMFDGLRHCLIPNGRVLLISQCSHYYVASDKNGAWEIKTGIFSSFQSTLDYKLEQQPRHDVYIEYAANLPETINLATQAGFSVVSTREFSSQDQIARENPWHSSPGFIVQLSL